jgi:hypothetical protein
VGSCALDFWFSYLFDVFRLISLNTLLGENFQFSTIFYMSFGILKKHFNNSSHLYYCKSFEITASLKVEDEWMNF